ncbi:hypothetical protein M514_02612 [Trichuris suis]|uniref:CID domain-containing protein n=1 Tax=Trichuris suis TaxID=68888 RepID=A0A085MH12_9BILA|nr:hypothetical protein M513_02612 [Trichuris suis]KFD71037.1 hypothetical protein M514_02612 [Trichuris suis]
MGDNAPSIEDVIDKFEYTLAPTQDVIESVSKWCLDRRQNHETIVKAWLALFYICKRTCSLCHVFLFKLSLLAGDPMRLSLLFLMNDVCQRERHIRCNKFRKAFMLKIKMIVLIARQVLRASNFSKALLPHLARIVKIWEERNVFSKELVNELRVLSSDELLNERSASVASLALSDLGQSTTSEPNEYDSSYVKLLREFDKPALIKAVRYYAEDKTVWLSPKNDPRGCIEKDELLKCMRDRERGRRTMSDVNSAFNRYYDAVDAHREKVVHLNKLVACLELAGIFYLTQGHEASMVCAAYHSFGERLASMSEECSDLLEQCPVVPPPTDEKSQADGKGESPQVPSASASVEEDPVLAQQIKAVLSAMRKEEDNEAVDMEIEEEEEEQRGSSFVSVSRSNVPPTSGNSTVPLNQMSGLGNVPSQPPTMMPPPMVPPVYPNQWRPVPPPLGQPKPGECGRPAPMVGPLSNWPQFGASNFDFRMPPPGIQQWPNFVPPTSGIPAAGLPCPLGNKPQGGEQPERFPGGYDQNVIGGPTPPKVFAQSGFSGGETDRFPNNMRANAGKPLLPTVPFQKPQEAPTGNMLAEFNGPRGQPTPGHFTNEAMNPDPQRWMQHKRPTGEDGSVVGMPPPFAEPMGYSGHRVGPPLGPLPSDRVGPPPPSDFVGSTGPSPSVGRFEDTVPQEGGGEMLPPPPYIGETSNPMIGDAMGPRHTMAPGPPHRGLLYPRHRFQGQPPFGNRPPPPPPPPPPAFDHSVVRMRAPTPPFRGGHGGNRWTPRPFHPTDLSTRWPSMPSPTPATDNPAWEHNVPYGGGGGAGIPNHMLQHVRPSLLDRPREMYPPDFSATRFPPVASAPLPPVRGGGANRRNFRRM